MLRELTELILPERRAERECEACGNPFRCGASLKGCWCFQVKLSAEARERLRRQYKDCLCLECLTQVTGEKLPEISQSRPIDQ